MKNKSFDFWPDKKMSYEQRDKSGAGDVYGKGEPPKVGSMRQTYMASAKSKGMKNPPKKIS